MSRCSGLVELFGFRKLNVIKVVGMDLESMRAASLWFDLGLVELRGLRDQYRGCAEKLRQSDL